MASRVGDIVIDCTDPELLAAFWAEVLDYRIFDRDETGVAILGASVSPDILFIRVPEGKRGEPTTDRRSIGFGDAPSGSVQPVVVTALP